MSFEAIRSVLKYSRAAATDRLVLLVLATHANDDYETFCGYRLIAAESNICERNVAYILKRLESSGEIIISRGSGRGQLTVYKINLPRVKEYQEDAPIPEKRRAKLQSDNLQPVAGFNESLATGTTGKRLQLVAPYQTQISQPVAAFSDQGETVKGCKPALETQKEILERLQTGTGNPEKSPGAYKEVEHEETIKEQEGSKPPIVPRPTKRLSVGAQYTVWISEVFRYWQAVLGHPEAKLDKDRRQLIKFRLLDKFTVADLCKAIDGCRASPYHQGDNERSEVYDRIGLIFENAESVERFMKYADSPPRSKPANGQNGGANNGRNLSDAKSKNTLTGNSGADSDGAYKSQWEAAESL